MVGVTPIVPICVQIASTSNAPATPPSKITDSTASAFGIMVITTRAPAAASGADPATIAPASASGSVTSADRSHTVVLSPAASSRRAIAEPMMPVPSTATRMSAFWLSVVAI